MTYSREHQRRNERREDKRILSVTDVGGEGQRSGGRGDVRSGKGLNGSLGKGVSSTRG